MPAKERRCPWCLGSPAYIAYKEFGSFDAYAWRFVGGKPKRNTPGTMKAVLAATAESDALSRDLKKRGFTFVGSTIMYAFMQATGLVDDHIVGCPAKEDR